MNRQAMEPEPEPESEPESPCGAGWAPSPWSSDPYGDAIAALKEEMAKVEALHAALDRRERELDESRQREADLLDVLSKWQQRA